MSGRHVRALLGAIAVLLLATLVAGCGSDSKGATGSTAATAGDDTDLASITLTPLGDAPKLRLGGTTDLPMVVNVWATWCVPCRKEMPAFEAVAKRLDGKVRFVGVNLGDAPDAAATFVTETGVTFDQYLDRDMTSQAALSIVSMPSTVLLRPDGTIARTHSGALDEAKLEALLRDDLDVTI